MPAQLPWPGYVTIEAKRVYGGKIVLNRETSTYDARLGGVWIARDVPVDSIIVTPVYLVK